MDASHRQGNLRRFFAYLRPYRWWLFLSTVVGVLKYNLPVVFPWILKDVVDRLVAGTPDGAYLSFNQLMAVAAAVLVAHAALTCFRTLLADRLAHRMTFDIRRDLFRHVQAMPEFGLPRTGSSGGRPSGRAAERSRRS